MRLQSPCNLPSALAFSGAGLHGEGTGEALTKAQTSQRIDELQGETGPGRDH